MATSQHIVGAGRVVEAYDALGIDTWAIFQGKVLMTAGENQAQLEKFLELIAPGSNGAMFTLRVYKNEEMIDIDDKTPYQGSINFRLGDMAGVGAVQGSTGYAAIIQRLDAMEKRIAGPEEDEDGPDLMQVIMGWLEQPEKLHTVMQVVRNIGAMLQGRAPMAVGAFDKPNKPAEGGSAEISESEKLERLTAALTTLEQANPELLFDLERLAKLSEENRKMFDVLIQQLRAI